MLYNPATPTIAQILRTSAKLLMDIGQRANPPTEMRDILSLAWERMVTQLKVHSLAEMEKTVDVVVPAGSVSFGPTWSAAVFKSALIDDMAKFDGPLFIFDNGFTYELKEADNPMDFNLSRSYYKFQNGVFYMTALIADTTFQVNYISNLACPAEGPCGLNDAFPYLTYMTAYLSGNADGNVGVKLDVYKSLADEQLNAMINNLLGEEGPVTPGMMDYDYNNGGSRRILIRSN